MSGKDLKKNLTVGSDKGKAQMRRPTPDSDVLASSDDEHVTHSASRPAPPFTTARRSSWMSQDLPGRKNSLGLPNVSEVPDWYAGVSEAPNPLDYIGDWPESWEKNFFASSKDTLPSPTAPPLPANKPTSEDTIGLLLGQNTVRKTGRSMSYSVGQAEPKKPLRSSIRTRPSKPSLLAESVSLEKVREDDIDELDSNSGKPQGVSLQGGEYWFDEPLVKDDRGQRKMVTKQVTIVAPPARRLSHSMRSLTQNDAEEPKELTEYKGMPFARRYSEHVGPTTPLDSRTSAIEDDFTRGYKEFMATGTAQGGDLTGPPNRRYSEYAGPTTAPGDEFAGPSEWAGPPDIAGFSTRRLSEYTGATMAPGDEFAGPSRRYSEYVGSSTAPGENFAGLSGRRYSEYVGTSAAPGDQSGRRYSEYVGSSTAPGEDFAGPSGRRYSEYMGTSAARGDQARRYSEYMGVTTAPDEYAGPSVPRFNADAFGRRHSIAHYGTGASSFAHPTLDGTQEEEEEEASPRDPSLPVLPPAQNDPKWNTLDYFNGMGPAARTINASAISAQHPAPVIPPPPNAYANPTGYGRVGRRIYVVQFKCSRSDIYYLYENTGLEIRVGDLVIVEGDRGHDLGQVTHADVHMDEAKRVKIEANEEHFRWLLMFSQYSVSGSSSKNPMLGSLYRAHEAPKAGRPQLSGMGVQQDAENKPRMIRRLAQQHEVMQLRDKEGEEARAKRMATDKALDHGLEMEILDAEFQWDHHKISFFYYAETYIDFKVLVTDLFKHYKIRIWMSAVNPASVVNPAGMQMRAPSAIGPGAIVRNSTPNASLSVGPLIGNNSYRSNEQYGNRGRSYTPQAAFDPTYHPFSHQLPQYPPTNPYQLHQWHAQAYGNEMYNRYDPNHPMNRSPMGMGGGWYPPGSYAGSK